MKSKKVITLLSKDMAPFNLERAVVGLVREWYKPKEAIARFNFKENAFLWTAADGNKDRYFMTSQR